MNDRPRETISRFARRLLAAAFGGCFALLLAVTAGPLRADPRIPDNNSQVDYFTAGSDPRAASMTSNVERFHMGEETFWKEFRAKQYGRALVELRFVLLYVPNHPKALHLLGEVSRLTGDLAYPIRYFERALKLYPHRAYTRAQYGAYLLSIGEAPAGIRELRGAIAADSTLLIARAWLHDAETKAAASPSHAP